MNALREEFATKYGKTGPAVERALSRLGGMCRRYRDRVDAWREISPGVLKLEAMNAVEVEHAETIEDIIRRRLDLEFLPSHGEEALDDVCEILARARSVDSLAEQRAAWTERLRALHQVLGIVPTPK
jgi:glycerol-3-phosphate dehydrogenase